MEQVVFSSRQYAILLLAAGVLLGVLALLRDDPAERVVTVRGLAALVLLLSLPAHLQHVLGEPAPRVESALVRVGALAGSADPEVVAGGLVRRAMGSQGAGGDGGRRGRTARWGAGSDSGAC